MSARTDRRRGSVADDLDDDGGRQTPSSRPNNEGGVRTALTKERSQRVIQEGVAQIPRGGYVLAMPQDARDKPVAFPLRPAPPSRLASEQGTKIRAPTNRAALSRRVNDADQPPRRAAFHAAPFDPA